jgi:hypothetical protein
MTGLAGSSRGVPDPRRSHSHGLTFKHWGGTLSGEGFGFRMIKPR